MVTCPPSSPHPHVSISTLSSWLFRLQGPSFFNTFPLCGTWSHFLLPHHPPQYWPPPSFSAHFNLVTSAKIFFFLSQINTFTEYGSSQGYLSKKYFSSLPEGLIVFKEIGIFRLFPKGKFNKKLTRAEKKLLDKNETDLNQPVEFLVDCFRKVGRPTLCQNLIFCYSLITSISKNTEISV